MELQPINLPTLQAEVVNGNGRLHGVSAPKYVIESEKPWHLAAAYLFAAGKVTNKEVADACHVDPATVSNLLKNQWFQERVSSLMADHGAKDIMQLFRAESFNSLLTLVELRDSTKAPSAVRRVCAVDILDRALGKPLQRIENADVPVSSDPVAEAQRLEEANARLRSASGSAAPTSQDAPLTNGSRPPGLAFTSADSP